MAEEFDALRAANPFGTILLIAGLVLLGIAVELALRLAQRRARARNWPLVDVILGALRWQPLFWGVLLGVALLLTRLSDISVARQQGLAILGALLLVSVTITAVRILIGWVKMLTRQTRSASVSILNYLINGLGIVVVLSVILAMLNVPVSLLLAALAGSTFGLSMAFRAPLSNLFAGVMLTASSRVKPGDFVRLPSGEEGRIVDIEWDTTTIRQLRNSLIIVPNSLLAESEIINYQRPEPEVTLSVAVGVSPDSDLDQVERVTIEVAEAVVREVSGGQPTYLPRIRYQGFGDSDVKFKVYMRGQEFSDQCLIRHEFVKRLQRRYQEEGIVMPLPALELYTPLGRDAQNDAEPSDSAPGTAPGEEG